jgi:hypothetical protein
VVASPIDGTFREALAFVRRQYLLGKLYVRDWWMFALLGFSVSNSLWLGNLAMLVWSLLGGPVSPWIPAGVAAVLYLVRVYRGTVRQDLVDVYFPHLKKTLRRSQRFDVDRRRKTRELARHRLRFIFLRKDRNYMAR